MKGYIAGVMMVVGVWLVADNWGVNHPLLIAPGSFLFFMGLDWNTDARIERSK